MTYRILTLDGGGIRGLVATVFLQRLCDEPGLNGWLDKVDFIAGTSTGALIALGIAEGLALATIQDVYVHKGPKIFDDSWLDNVRDLGNLIGAQYDTDTLKKVVDQLFNVTTLGELRKVVLIPTFDLDNYDPANRNEPRRWKPKLFHNVRNLNNDAAEIVASVALRACAAPTYFPSVDGYIDGGVYANNPSMCALAQTQEIGTDGQRMASIDDIVMLSLGSGTNLEYIKGNSKDWGLSQWVKPLINLMNDGTVDIARYQCAQMLGERFHRLAPYFPPGSAVKLDGATDREIEYLVKFADEEDIGPCADWLRENWT